MSTKNLNSSFIDLKNKLIKNHGKFHKYFHGMKTTCYRLYSKDIPNYPLQIEYFGGTDSPSFELESELTPYLVIWPMWSDIDPADKRENLIVEVKKFLVEIYHVSPENIFVKERAPKTHKSVQNENDVLHHDEVNEEETLLDSSSVYKSPVIQYEKQNDKRSESVKTNVFEAGFCFLLNLTDYIDVGLFLGHRPLRSMLRKECHDKDILNLFSYTGSISVMCGSCDGSHVTSVDLSKTYLQVLRQNILNNNQSLENHQAINIDVLTYLINPERKNQKFDIIIFDPPTFSVSKKTDNVFDVIDDHEKYIHLCMNLLKLGGKLYFSTNCRDFRMSPVVFEKY